MRMCWRQLLLIVWLIGQTLGFGITGVCHGSGPGHDVQARALFAYDGQNLVRTVYDGGFLAVFNYTQNVVAACSNC